VGQQVIHSRQTGMETRRERACMSSDLQQFIPRQLTEEEEEEIGTYNKVC